MRMLLAFTSALGLASAHFDLNYPPSRSSDEDKMPTFPCGGGTTPSPNRTQWPMAGGPVQLLMGHSNTNIQVLIGLGNDPGSAFNTVLVKTFTVNGLGNFCIASVPIPQGLNVTAGQNATIQVVSNGDSGGGLYNCADITFTDQAHPQGEMCMNATSVQAVAFSNPNANANTTTSSSSSSSGSSGGSGYGSSGSKSDASGLAVSLWGLFLGAGLTVAAWL